MFSMYSKRKFEIESVEVIYYDEKFYISLEPGFHWMQMRYAFCFHKTFNKPFTVINRLQVIAAVWDCLLKLQSQIAQFSFDNKKFIKDQYQNWKWVSYLCFISGSERTMSNGHAPCRSIGGVENLSRSSYRWFSSRNLLENGIISLLSTTSCNLPLAMYYI